VVEQHEIRPTERITAMLDKPTVTETKTQPTAVIHLTIPKDQIQNVMGPGLNELMSTIAAQGIKPTGPWFTHHLKIADDFYETYLAGPESSPDSANWRTEFTKPLID
jgi:hypothetical protein